MKAIKHVLARVKDDEIEGWEWGNEEVVASADIYLVNDAEVSRDEYVDQFMKATRASWVATELIVDGMDVEQAYYIGRMNFSA